MTSDYTSNEAACLKCGHSFSAEEAAGMEALAEQEDLCIVKCQECGSNNIIRVEPQGGFDEQPGIVVLRLATKKPDTADVFDESVEPGTDVHPITRGESA